MKKIILISLLFSSSYVVIAQSYQNFSSVNPALFMYRTDDVQITPPTKYNNGKYIIPPLPDKYPWEAKMENGMPNSVVDNNGNLSVYMSSFLVFSQVPFSKVGAFVYTNSSNDITQWTRPDAGLYWYNPKGQTADEKISATYDKSYQSTNIVAVDIESVGLFVDKKTLSNPVKLVYLPQREELNKLIAGYEMPWNFDNKGILSGFSKMKNDRAEKQIKYNFDFINGDTHMSYLKIADQYYMLSRINAKRSTLFPGESLPFPTPDPRMRYRRETVTALGNKLMSGHYTYDVSLDMSNRQWEPYSVQAFQLDGFESDLWYGLVTVFGTRADEKVANRQRTELAITNNGTDWRYLKPGTPFLDNGASAGSDDHGCINMGKPVLAGRFSQSSNDLLYFYAASPQLHLPDRNSGLSLAIGKYGKWAGLYSGSTEKQFVSPALPNGEKHLTPQISLYEALRHNAIYAPEILADITEDPRGKRISVLKSYASVSMFAYDTEENGSTDFSLIAGSMGSSQQGTSNVSDEYESVGIVDGTDLHSKSLIFEYMKKRANKVQHIISLKDDLHSVPVIFDAKVKNATFYGIRVKNGDTRDILSTKEVNGYRGKQYWDYKPSTPTMPCHTEYFDQSEHIPNEFNPSTTPKGSIAIRLTPLTVTNRWQTLLRLHGDYDNNIGLYYMPDGSFFYQMMTHGTEFASMKIYPPEGNTFLGKEIIITVEALNANERKYATETKEDATVLRVSCPALQYENTAQQEILWRWKHDTPTEEDKANARCFAYAQFSAFISSMTKITVGAADEDCNLRFYGKIEQVEIAERLPRTAGNDFWE